jgi:nicotinate-nucleotide pyrophosphorylase (carboxylating)
MLNVPQSEIEDNVAVALREDIGTGDLTAELIPEDTITLASVITREPCVLCGMDWFEEVFRQIDDEIFIEWNVDDGDSIDANETLCSISGPARAILTGERTALNFIQTLSATATRAAQYAAAVSGTNTIILDTRKTIPGLRLAQKYAVSCGGCQNHRLGLYDAVLIKENHIAAHGSIGGAVEEARFLYPDTLIEVEVENLNEFEQALESGANRVLLDNFSLNDLRAAVALNAGKIELEASGNVTLDNIKAIADTGVNFISTGALTKDIKAIDLSMRFL